ncbi:hypothetical protein [Polaribacter sp. SA4-12]|uniref:hypothetical protein n=1 Tax=Polaribacter sp. SA4-12 TaxID=1312072 RepID=UPI0012F903FC|nr:hypothetical protein [Polaribacter sp. SA4-12]
MILMIIILTVTIHLFIGSKHSPNAIATNSITGIFLCNPSTSTTFFKSIRTIANRMIINSRGSKIIRNLKT